MKTAVAHSERKHSKFSASGAERWFECPGSVALSEGLPDKDTVHSIAGTRAHEVLEKILRVRLWKAGVMPTVSCVVTPEMLRCGERAAEFIIKKAKKSPHAEVMVETRIHLPFIHEEMFGTFDSAIVDHFGTLHVFDYKFGKKTVSPIENLQMIFYGIGLAEKFHWNFKRVRLWIVQPRSPGYDGPAFWEMGIMELKAYVPQFRAAVKRVETEPSKYVEGNWCYFCKAKGKCPLKQNAKLEKTKSIFTKIAK